MHNFLPIIWSFPINTLILWQNHQAMKLIKGEFKEKLDLLFAHTGASLQLIKITKQSVQLARNMQMRCIPPASCLKSIIDLQDGCKYSVYLLNFQILSHLFGLFQ